MTRRIAVYLEVTRKRTFAGAVEWPGWCRSGKTPEAALEALVAYADRYAAVISRSRLGFERPTSVDDLEVVERLEGNATTEFGAPGVAPNADSRPLPAAELKRLTTILEASWRALDRAAHEARGVTLTKGRGAVAVTCRRWSLTSRRPRSPTWWGSEAGGQPTRASSAG